MNEDRVTFQTPSDSSLQAQIDLKATPERVYAAWTEPGAFPKWFGPRNGGHLQVDRFECEIGGAYDVTMVFADGDRAQMIGKYLELDPPRKLVLTWQWMSDDTPSDETLVTVDLAPSALGTQLTLTHERFPTVQDRNNHQEGWPGVLARLDSYLSD